MSESKVEEILMLLGFIAAFLAYLCGAMVLSKLFFGKACFDFCCALCYAYKEVKAKREI